MDQAAQIGLLATNKDQWLYNPCHTAINSMVTASKLAREEVGNWANICPKYGGLVQGDDTYNFCFTGVGAPLCAYGRSDQQMSHALFLQGLLGACKTLYTMIFDEGYEPLDNHIKRWFVCPGGLMNAGGKILSGQIVKTGLHWDGPANPDLCSPA